MHRRDFLKTTGTVLAAAALPSPAPFSPNPTATKQSAGRLILPMNRNWLYHPAKLEGAHAPGFDDSAFDRVVIPHTNVRLPWHSFDDKDYEFVSIYRRRFKLPPEAKVKRRCVVF